MRVFRAELVRVDGLDEEWLGSRVLKASTVEEAESEALTLTSAERSEANLINITADGLRVRRIGVAL